MLIIAMNCIWRILHGIRTYLAYVQICAGRLLLAPLYLIGGNMNEKTKILIAFLILVLLHIGGIVSYMATGSNASRESCWREE